MSAVSLTTTRWTSSRLVSASAFVATVVAANVMTANLPLVFGMTAGTFIAGLALLARDWLNEAVSWRWVLGCVLMGAGLSAVMAGPRLALASGLAFGMSELADWAIYRRLRRHGWIKAADRSNAAGALVDSVLFLAVAGFPVWPGAAVQTVVKFAVTALTLRVVAHAVLRDRLNRAGA